MPSLPKMQPADLSRAFLLDVSASGHVQVRQRGAKRVDGFLPAFSTDTAEEAESLIVLRCKRASDGSGVYALWPPPRDLAELALTTSQWRRDLEALRARRRQRERPEATTSAGHDYHGTRVHGCEVCDAIGPGHEGAAEREVSSTLPDDLVGLASLLGLEEHHLTWLCGLEGHMTCSTLARSVVGSTQGARAALRRLHRSGLVARPHPTTWCRTERGEIAATLAQRLAR